MLIASLLGLSSLIVASPANAVSAIESATVVVDTAPASTVQTTTADVCTGVGACGAPVTLNHGMGDRLALTDFVVGGEEYQVLPWDTGQSHMEFLRIDNQWVQGVRDNIWEANPTGDTNPFDLVGSDITNENMEYALSTARLTSGTDNIFANNGGSGPNPNNIERASLMNETPMSASDPSKLGVMIAERGGNDSFKIAAVTAVDADGTPTAWGPIVTVSRTDWGTIVSGVTTTVMMRQQGVDTTYRPSAWTSAQNIAGVYVSFDELGIASGQSVYGVSLAGGDENSMETGHDWNLQTPYDNEGGLDMVSATFASAVDPDMTLTKTADPASGTAVTAGDTITYTVEAQNVGNTVLDPVVVTDDVSDAFADGTYNGDVVTRINGTVVTDDPATITGDELSWNGSLQPFEVLTITYSITVNDGVSGQTVDNSVTASGTPPSGETITPPPAETEHPVVDPGFDIAKTADPASGTTVNAGQTITYTVTGSNTGDTALDPASIDDDLSDVLDNATYNDDATATIDGVSAGDVALDGSELSWTGSLAAGETVTITYSVTVDADAGGELLHNTVTGTATPPTGPEITPPPAETQHPVSDPGFEIAKSADPTSGTAVDPGQTITYTVTGSNTGDTALDPATLSDDLSTVLDNATYNDDATATVDGADSGDLTVDGTELTWTGSLAAGETVTITYSVTVNADAGGELLENTVTGSATPPGLPPITPPPAQTEHPVNEPGFEIAKSADPTSGTAVDPGQTITYTVTGSNTGETALDPVEIVDDLSEVLDAAAYNDDATATIDGADSGDLTVDGTDLSWTGSLAAGQTVTITYSVTVGSDAAGEVIANTVTGTATPPGGEELTPPPAETEHPVNVPGFSVSKAADPASGTAVDPGSVITYSVTGVNTGETALDPVTVEDDLSAVLDHAVYNDDATATIDGGAAGEVSVDATDLSWTGSLAVGQTVTITYSVTVDGDAGGQILENSVTGEATPPGGVPPIETPPAVTEHPVNEPGFEIVKSADPASGTAVDPGQTITYTVTGSNTGETALEDVEITDDLSAVLDHAVYNDDAAAAVGGAPAADVTVEGTELSWSGSLQVGETVTITYSVTVDGDAGGVTVENTVSGTAVPPGGSHLTPPPVSTEHPVNEPGFEFSKSADPASGTAVATGSTVTYTLTGVNTGETVLSPVTISDDLSGVLAYASYDGDAVARIGGQEVAAPVLADDELSWSGTLQVGETVTITYSVTVDADAAGKTLENVAVATATPPGNAEITPPPSSTEHPVRTPLAVTGAQVAPGIIALGILLIVGGSVLIGIRRRSQA